MSKYLMYCPETDAVCGQIADRYNALEELTGELDGAVAMTYAATGFGVGNIRQSILIQKTEIEKQMANLLLIQKTLSEIKNCTETYENNARNIILKAILIELLTDPLHTGTPAPGSDWSDIFDKIEEFIAGYDGISDLLDLIQLLDGSDMGLMGDILGRVGDVATLVSILVDISEGEYLEASETAVTWIVKYVLIAAGLPPPASGFTARFLVGYVFNAGEAAYGYGMDAYNGEGIFADGFDLKDIWTMYYDIKHDSANESIYDIVHDTVQGLSIVNSWTSGSETFDEAYPEFSTYDGFKEEMKSNTRGIYCEWLI